MDAEYHRQRWDMGTDLVPQVARLLKTCKSVDFFCDDIELGVDILNMWPS